MNNIIAYTKKDQRYEKGVKQPKNSKQQQQVAVFSDLIHF